LVSIAVATDSKVTRTIIIVRIDHGNNAGSLIFSLTLIFSVTLHALSSPFAYTLDVVYGFTTVSNLASNPI
jgi:hypothetical protein